MAGHLQPRLCTPGGTWILNSATVNLFGADGKQLASYGPIPAWNNMTTNQVAITFGPVAVRSYFGGKLVGQQLGTNIYEPVIQDRLGSVGKYYPYGEERNSPQLPNDQVKFATYTRDSATGNDYADQRYYTSVLGRFMTMDPFRGSASLGNPQSWNRYAYAVGDPANSFDPTGLDVECSVVNGNFTCVDNVSTPISGSPIGGGVPYLNPLTATLNQINAAVHSVNNAANQFHQALCSETPGGRVVGLNGSLGVLAGVAGSAEIVLDYSTGQAYLVLSGGMGAFGNGAQVGASTGFIYGAGDPVPSFASGGNTSATVAFNLGLLTDGLLGVLNLTATATANSGGLTGDPTNLNFQSATSYQIGLSLGLINNRVPSSGTATNTVDVISLGSFLTGPAALLASPVDSLLASIKQGCK